jgi:peptidoglycan/LPS O-acetylase OafA/YrhL
VLKRFCRIYLPYAASLAFSIVVFALVHPAPMPELTSWFNSTWADGISMDAVAENALLVGTYYSASLNNVNWSLVYELRISILFPFLVEAIAVFGIPGVLGGTLLLSVACDVLLYLLGTGPTPYFEATLPKALLATFHFVVFFALGAALAVEIQKSESRLRALDPLLVKLLCIVAVIGGMASIDLVNAAGATALIVVCLVMPKLSAWLDRPLPQFLGRISFSLYLVHLPILVGLTHLLYGLVDQFEIIALAIALSLVTATLAYEAVERPAVRAGRLLSRRMTGETPG